LEQKLNLLRVPHSHGFTEYIRSVQPAGNGIGACSQQQFHGIGMTIECGDRQGRLACLILCFDVGAREQQPLNGVRVSRLCSLKQSGIPLH
jgi:hypothetical protein